MNTKSMALVKNGVVTNIAVFNETDAENERWRAGFCLISDIDELVPAVEGFGVGDLYKNGQFELSQNSIERKKLFKSNKAEYENTIQSK